MNFQYVVKSKDGNQSCGSIDAPSAADARRLLLEQGQFPLSLTAASSGAGAQTLQRKSSGLSMQINLFEPRVSKSDLLMTTSQLYVMSHAGIDIAESIQSIAENCTHPGMKKILDQIYSDVATGLSVSVALEKHVKVFGESYVSAIAAAEASGTMTQALKRLGDMIRNEIRLRGTIGSALSYPLALCTISMGVVGAMFFFVLPQFGSVFENLGKTPPPFTTMLLGIAKVLKENLLIVGLTALGIVGGAVYSFLAPATKRFWHSIAINTVPIRKATRPLLMGQMFRLLATMLQSRVPLLEAIRLCQRSVKNLYFRELFQKLEQEVQVGHGLSDTLAKTHFIPPSAAQMVRTAERSGKLGDILETVGQFYEEEGERQLHKLVKLLEPIIVVGMGVLVAGVVAAVIIPLLDVSSAH